MLQEIQVRGGGGLKNYPIRRGGVDFFWNNPMALMHMQEIAIILVTWIKMT